MAQYMQVNMCSKPHKDKNHRIISTAEVKAFDEICINDKTIKCIELEAMYLKTIKFIYLKPRVNVILSAEKIEMISH